MFYRAITRTSAGPVYSFHKTLAAAQRGSGNVAAKYRLSVTVDEINDDYSNRFNYGALGTK